MLAKNVLYWVIGAVSTDPSDDLRARKNAGSPRLDVREAIECIMESIYVMSVRHPGDAAASVKGYSYRRCRQLLFSRDPSVVIYFPSWFRNKGWKREPVVKLVLLKICEGDEEKS